MRRVSTLLFAVALLPGAFSKLVIYPHAPDAPQSDRFQVFVSQTGVAEESFVYMTSSDHRVNQSGSVIAGRTLSWSSFAFSGQPVTVQVLSHAPFHSCTVRPTRYNITCRATGASQGEFRVSDPGSQMSVELDSDQGGPLKDITHKLLVFADHPETQVPARNDSTVLYFDVGRHDLQGQLVVPRHIKQVYLAPGAFVEGGFISTSGSSIKIHGRGVVDTRNYAWHDPRFRWSTINLDEGQGHVVEGITMSDPMQFLLRALSSFNTVSNVKTVGAWVYNNDGISLGYGGVLRDTFIHANDDSIKVYASNMTVERCVVWQAQNGAVFQFGWWTSRSIRHVRVTGIDVIHSDWCTFKGDHCHISPNDAVFDMGGNTTIVNSSDLIFTDVRVEGLCPRLVNFALAPLTSGSFSNVTLVDWVIGSLPSGDRALRNVIAGAGRAGRIENWAFVNLVVGGACVNQPSMAHFDIDENTTSNITFTCS